MADTTGTILDRTKIFNFKYASQGEHKEAHRVRIVQNTNKLAADGNIDLVAIEGYLRDPINFDMAARWEQKEGIISSLLSSEIANTVLEPASRVGFGAGHAGYVTKKYYTGGTDLVLSISMRITDEEGTGEIIESIAKLSAFLLPAQQGEISVAEMLPEVTEATKKSLKEAVESPDTDQGLGTKAIKIAAARGFDEMTDAGLTLTSSPVPVSLFVGEYFAHNDMVITSCSISFSKELVEIKLPSEKSNADGKNSDATVITYCAPLYADVTLSLASRENLYLKKSENGAKGTVINSTYWGYDARNKIITQNSSKKE